MKKLSAIIAILLLSGCLARAQSEDPLTRAREALFVTSDLDAARAGAATVLARTPNDPEALFISMEAAALRADTPAELDAALRLCEGGSSDPRATIAAARILKLAANTVGFRAVLPRIEALVAAGGPQTTYLRAALLKAAVDGMPGFSPLQLARDAGLLTDWRIGGPFGRFANVDFEIRWSPEQDGMVRRAYDGRTVESFRFESGNVALPSYFDYAGVFYAASEISIASAGAWLLRAESPGTLEVFVDGASVLEHDGRFRDVPNGVSTKLQLAAGAHRVLVKFIPAAMPFRIALLAQPDRSDPNAPAIAFPPEAQYVAAAWQYWTGDHAGALAALRTQPATAITRYLLAQAWTHADPDSPEPAALLRAVLRQSPGALVAEYDLAVRDYAEDRLEETFARAQRVANVRPDFAPAFELLAQAAVRLNWRAEAAQATDARLRLHPSCDALGEAARFYLGASQFQKAEQTEARLQNCGPESLAYAEALRDAGRHAEAARAAATVAAENPLNRAARALLVRELAMAGDIDGAHRAANELLALAPNSQGYRQLAAAVQTGGLADEDATPARAFAGESFYAPFRRDPFQVLKDAAGRRFPAANAVTLLSDRVVRMAPDGSVAVYVHKLIQVLNRDGIERYGEVSLPVNADVLELRTIKPDGSTAEPELTRHKATTSMPALAPGDAIEQEYVHRVGGGFDDTRVAQFTFGAFGMPVVLSRFVALWPTAKMAGMQVMASDGTPLPGRRPAGEMTATIWEQNDIPPAYEERSMPSSDALPTIRVLPSTDWSQVRDYYRDLAIAATRIGNRVEELARSLQGRSDEDKARDLYRKVVSRVRPAAELIGSGESRSAENTLASGSGDRTAVLLATARAAGIRAELLLVRNAGSQRPAAAQFGAYTRPLVRFHVGGREIVVDAQTEGMAFGALSPAIERRDALLVPIATNEQQLAQTIVTLPDTSAVEQSIAEGEVALDASGGLQSRVTIRMGATRAAQMRSVLNGIAPGQRQHFFEQLALRIFPGAGSASGEVRNEYDLERPLEILLVCRAPHFVNLDAGLADLDQLVPALGLRKMYGVGYRRFPLYVDAPLFETATFRLRLPAHMLVAHRPPDVQLKTDFGQYSITFRRLADGRWEIRRAFRVPVQVVPPDRFPAFSRFALRIEDAERQRLMLQHEESLRGAR